MVHGRSAFLALALLLFGCTGPTGPQGAPADAGSGTPGPQGQTGVAGPPGPSGASDDAGGAFIPVGCLSPCHGFNGVVAQFQASVHYTEYLANVSSPTPEAEWTAPGAPCGNCHAIDALQVRVSGNVLTTDGGVVANLASGELQYRDPVAGGQSSANYAGSATVAEVYCTTCHAVTNANDPHKTGIPWTPGSFPLQIADDGGSVWVEKSPGTTAVTGLDAGNFGPGDTCMWCHRSRVDITNYIAPTGNAITSVRWGPHEGPQADLFTGIGGYQYAGKVYGQSTHEQKLSCVDCHMVTVSDNSNVPDHSFNPSLSACLSCHATATNFDVTGFETTIQGGLTLIERWLNDRGFLTRATAAPYVALDDATQIGDGNWAQDQPVPGATLDSGLLTQDQAGALYNYILVARGGAYGVHNPKYIGQLVVDSYFALSGAQAFARPQ
jgi:hypothetical protein